MDTEITVFEVPQRTEKLTKTQQELEYEELKRASKLEGVHFDEIYTMEQEYVVNQPPNTNVQAIKCKYVCAYGIPILGEENFITIQTDNATLVKINDTYRSIPANEPFNVVGMIFPIVVMKNYDKTQYAFFELMTNKTLKKLGLIGLKYSSGRYTMADKKFPYFGVIKAEVTFNDEVFETLIDYISSLHRYYKRNLLSLYACIMKPIFNKFERKTTKLESEVNNTELLKQLADATDGNYESFFMEDVFYKLDRNKLNYAYDLGLLLGLDNEIYKQVYNQQKNELEYRHRLENFTYESEIRRMDLALKQNIAFEKFGSTALTDKQKNILQLEFEKIKKRYSPNDEDKRIQQLFLNLRESFKTNNDDIKKALHDIEQSVPNMKDEILPCGECPHLYEYGKLLLRYSRDLGDTIKKEMIARYALPEIKSGFYCKICGEHIADSDREGIIKFLGGVRVDGVRIEDPLQNMIWKETTYVISSYVKFNTPIPVKPLVNSIVIGLRDVIGEKESALIRSRTNTVDSVKDTLSLYTNIYVYAALCSIMMVNPNKIMFGRDKQDTDSQKNYIKKTAQKNTAEGGSVRKRVSKHRYKGGAVTENSKLYEKYILTTALNLILISKDPIIKRLKNINIDIVKHLFLKEAYTWAKKYVKPIKVSPLENLEDPVVFVISKDPFYDYLYYAQRLSYYGRGNPDKPQNIADIVKILGRTPEKINADFAKGLSVFETAQVPKPWKFGDAVFDKYTYDSFMMIYDYIHGNIQNYPFSPRHGIVSKYYSDYEHVLTQEKEIMLLLGRKNCYPIMTIEWLNDFIAELNNFSNLDYAQHYCDTGSRHKTSSYIYSDGKKEMELETKDIIGWIDNSDEKLSEFANMKIIDERCGLCKKLIRTAVSDKKSNLKNKFKKIADYSAFYQYFIDRCPEGNLHEIENSVCTKCGYSSGKKAEYSENDTFYKKYVQVYKNIELEKQRFSIESLEQVRIELKKDFVDEKRDEHKTTFKNVAEWSKISGVKYNVIVNLGLGYDNEYTDIESGKVNPSNNERESFKTQVMIVKNYVLSTLRQYSMFRNYNNTARLSIEMNKILDIVRDVKFSDFQRNMPNFKQDFTSIDKYYSNYAESKNYSNFLLEYLAGFFIKLNNLEGKYESVGKQLSELLTNNIIEQNKMYYKAESIYSKMNTDVDIEMSDSDENISADELLGTASENNETEEEVFNFEEAYDVEDANDIWEQD